ncbi:MAG: AraC family transcriptional regulator [Porticoccaceae bacterium]|jgi:AraC family transcriptional regulator
MRTIQEAFHTESTFFNCTDNRVGSSAYDIQINELRLPNPGAGVYRSDSHCFLQYVLVPEQQVQGSYPARIAGRSMGQLMFVPPGATLEWHWSTGRQRAISCMFELEKVGSLGIYEWDWDSVDLSRTLDIRNDYLMLGMRKLAEEAIAPGFASELQIESTLTLMALELRKQFFAGEQALRHDRNGRLGPEQLQMIRDYIEAHLKTEITVADIARECELSARTLTALFKSATGMTLRQTVAQARLDRARAMLANPRLLIKQVGYECGFRGAAAFVAAFHKATGMTPAQYRQRFS